LVDTGKYRVAVQKPGFDFPSVLIKNKLEDGSYTDLYHGDEINVNAGEKVAVIANIPIDQQEVIISNKDAVRNFSKQSLYRYGSWIGPIFSAVYVIIAASWYSISLFIVHLLLLWYFRRLALKRRGRNWGMIFDKNNKKPIKHAVTRIFSSEYGRMLEFYVTDNYGRYGFLAEDNKYYVTADKDGYQTSKTEIIDLQKASEEQKLISRDIGLEKAQAGTETKINNDLVTEAHQTEIIKEKTDDLTKPIETLVESKEKDIEVNKTEKIVPPEIKIDENFSIDLGSIDEAREKLQISPETEDQAKKIDQE
jgi:hypothetical protein